MSRQIGRAGAFATALTALLLLAPAAAAEEAAGPAIVDELGSQLQPLRSPAPADVRDARANDLTIAGGRVLVDVYVEGDPAAAAARLRELGMEVAATAREPLGVVEGSLPLDSLTAAARLARTNAVLPVQAYGTDVGAQTSQGVAAHNLPAATAAAGTSGAGIDVGVISDSIDQVGGGVDDSQASGDLPPDPQVVVLDDDTRPGASDEGRAMAEIVYDEAPGLSRILFATGTETGAVGKAASIDSLVANGADVITDDIFYLSEPFFQDGVITQAADRAKAAGVPYFASAGNRARQSYESFYRGGGGTHDFDPGPGVDPRSCFSGTVPTGAFIQVALQWDEPFGAATTDLDLALTTSGGTPLATSNDANQTTGIPREIATFANLGPAMQVCVEITRFAGSRDPFMKWIEFDNFNPTPVPEFDTASDTINPDAASARGALAVAAVSAVDPGNDTPEVFSSRGPKARLFDASGARLAAPEFRAKPELAAADRVSTTVPGFETFSGTSAASPSAAGIAAILRSANPQATVNEIYAQMTDPANAIDCSLSALVPDPDCGAGFILADRTVAGLDRTPVKPQARTRPRRPDGKAGWFTKRTVSVSWDTIDPDSPTESSSGCEPRKVKEQGKAKLTCSAVSGGGPGATTKRIKHDSRKPARPKFRGIAARSYGPAQLPPKGKVRCESKDATSGLKSCRVRGFSSRPGTHTLKATATDRAGLKSKRKLIYRVR